MHNLPYEIKLMYIIAIIVMMFFVGFIIFVVILYNRKQLLYIKEKQLQEAELQNTILQKELEQQKLIEAERQRISLDMHDEIGAGISALKLHAEFMKQKIDSGNDLHNDINDILLTSEEMNKAMREMLWNLNSKNDNILSFVQYTTTFTENFFRKSKIIVDTENYLSENHNITAEQRRNLFLCFKEALNNVYKHSFASEIKVIFENEGSHFKTTISDNGNGFDVAKTKGNGLPNMKLRMLKINGSYDVKTSENGTLVMLSLDLKN